MHNLYKDINKVLAGWILSAKSNRDFALSHNIDEKTVRRILDKKEYRISLMTLKKICYSRCISLEEFFNSIGH